MINLVKHAAVAEMRLYIVRFFFFFASFYTHDFKLIVPLARLSVLCEKLIEFFVSMQLTSYRWPMIAYQLHGRTQSLLVNSLFSAHLHRPGRHPFHSNWLC